MSSTNHDQAVSVISQKLTSLRLENYRRARWNAIHAARTLEPPMTWEQIGDALGVLATAASRMYRSDAPTK